MQGLEFKPRPQKKKKIYIYIYITNFIQNKKI